MIHSLQEAIERIRQFRKIEGLAKSRLATLAGVPEGVVRKIDSASWNPTLTTLKKLEAVIPSGFTSQKTKKPRRKTD